MKRAKSSEDFHTVSWIAASLSGAFPGDSEVKSSLLQALQQAKSSRDFKDFKSVSRIAWAFWEQRLVVLWGDDGQPACLLSFQELREQTKSDWDKVGKARKAVSRRPKLKVIVTKRRKR
jgi:hypothetical protein